MTRPGKRRVDLPDGACLDVWIAGTGAPMLLVSGLGGTAAFWGPGAARLAARFRVVSFNQRGIGGSTRGQAPCTIETLARDCLAVVEALGLERVLLVGHSTGGCIGQSFAALAPERLSGLVLSATWQRPSAYMQALFGLRKSLLWQDPMAYAAMASLLAYPADWLEGNWAVHEAAVAKAPATEAARRIVAERIEALLAFDGRALPQPVQVPTLVLGARDDAVVPAFLQADLHAALPASHLVMLETGGHFFPVSRTPAFVASIKAFADLAG
ncbi:alpha/beta fold hydrolase [Xanthobacter wiegelii]|uniref:alpha/beta fold hydrolase n=1 Tax=Xanthobacter wiegelii TaxID=3119913 RepID=UPI003728F6DF